MKHLFAILVALTCATLHAQSVIVKGTGAGSVLATGAGSVRGVATKKNQTITNFPNPGTQYTNSAVELWAQASSGLDVTNFAVAIGPGTIDSLTNLTFTGTGSVSVTANQLGNNIWYAAPTVTNTFDVVVFPATNYCDGRFTVWNTNQDVVVDNDSGITWTRDASIGGALGLWDDAMAYVANLTNGTYSDWRMPSIDEFSRNIASGSTDGLVDYPSTNGLGDPALPTGHPFTSVELGLYWSSTESGSDVWRLLLNDGSVATGTKEWGHYIWPCRGP